MRAHDSDHEDQETSDAQALSKGWNGQKDFKIFLCSRLRQVIDALYADVNPPHLAKKHSKL